MLQEAFKPFSVVAVTTVLPLFFPVTSPFSSTVATVSSEEVHVSVLIVVLSGFTVAVSCLLSPILTEALSSESETLSASTFCAEGSKMF